MNDLQKMMQAYQACTSGTEEPDWISFPSYEDYAKSCQWWGITPISEEEMGKDDDE